MTTPPHLEGLIRKVEHLSICLMEPQINLLPQPAPQVIERYADQVNEILVSLKALAALPGGGVDGGEHLLRFGPFVVSASNEGGAWSIVVAQGRKVCAIVDETGPVPVYATPRANNGHADTIVPAPPPGKWAELVAKTEAAKANSLPTPNPHEADR